MFWIQKSPSKFINVTIFLITKSMIYEPLSHAQQYMSMKINNSLAEYWQKMSNLFDLTFLKSQLSEWCDMFWFMFLARNVYLLALFPLRIPSSQVYPSTGSIHDKKGYFSSSDPVPNSIHLNVPHLILKSNIIRLWWSRGSMLIKRCCDWVPSTPVPRPPRA